MTEERRRTVIIIGIGLIICLAAVVTGLLTHRNEPAPPQDKQVPEQETPEEKPAQVSVTLPDGSRGKTADATVTNLNGETYNYRMFDQRAGYDSYSAYLRSHGCSTCALTTILRATVPELSDLTPDKAITDIIYPVIGDKTFNKNFSKSKKRQMPITLSGMTLVLDKYGVEYRRPAADMSQRESQITKWLKKGDPVIFTMGNGSAANLSKHTHTVLLLGIDDDGYVIIGDSLHKSAKHWGKDGLLKPGRLTVADMLSFIKKDDGWTIFNEDFSSRRVFYKDSADRGYLLVRK